MKNSYPNIKRKHSFLILLLVPVLGIRQTQIIISFGAFTATSCTTKKTINIISICNNYFTKVTSSASEYLNYAKCYVSFPWITKEVLNKQDILVANTFRKKHHSETNVADSSIY